MKLLVEIGSSQDTYEIHKNEVVIGADPDCDIVLNQPGLGRKHLKIFEREGSYRVIDFGSGTVSKLNGKELRPNESVEFNSIFPIEVAGILISLGDESSTEESLDQSLNKLSSNIEKTTKQEQMTPVLGVETEDLTELTDEELIQKIKTSYKKTGTNRISDFKPNISDPYIEEQKTQNTNSSINIKASGTGSHKINLKDIGTGSRKIKIGSKKGKGTRRRQIKRDRSIGPILLMSLTFILSGGLYYFKFVKPATDVVFKEKKPQVKKEIVINYKTIISDALKKKEIVYNAYFNQNKCKTSEEKHFCSAMNLDLKNGSGALILNSNLYIGIHLNDFSKLESELVPNIVRDEPHLKRLIEKDYEEFFNFNEFATNNYIPQNQIFHFNSTNYKYLNLSLFKLLDEKIKQGLLANSKINEVVIFTFETVVEDIEVQSFISLRKQGLEYLFNDISYLKSILKDYYIYKLNKGIEDFYKKLGETQFNNWDHLALVNEKNSKVKVNLLESYEKSEDCKSSKVKALCDHLMDKYKIFNVYVYLNEESVNILYNQEYLLRKFKTYTKDYKYNHMEVKELLDYLKKSKINIPLTLLSQNDFIYKEYETQMFLESLIFDEFLKLDHNILKNFDSEKLKINLVLYDNDPKKIKSYLSLSGDNLEKIVPGSFNVEHRYLTRSNIPSYELVFKNFMINKVIFEKFAKESSETQ